MFLLYIRSKSRTKDKVCPLMGAQGNIVVQDEDVCNVLNRYFGSVYTSENTDVSEKNLNDLRDLFSGDQNDVLQDVIITEHFVLNKLKKLKINKAPGVDGLVPKVLVKIAGVICNHCALFLKHHYRMGLFLGTGSELM